jgi:hypothetical protein
VAAVAAVFDCEMGQAVAALAAEELSRRGIELPELPARPGNPGQIREETARPDEREAEPAEKVAPAEARA